jgi:hypothetical protein
MRNYFRVLAAMCLLGTGSTAGAASVDLGTVAPGGFAGASLLFSSGSSVVDDWTFTIDSALMTAISFDSNDTDPFFGISGFTVSSADVGPFLFVPADNAWSFSGVLAAGTYVIDVVGAVTGSFAGQYNALVGTSPVPVPAAFWMFGSGLLGLVLVSRRKLFT